MKGDGVTITSNVIVSVGWIANPSPSLSSTWAEIIGTITAPRGICQLQPMELDMPRAEVMMKGRAIPHKPGLRLGNLIILNS
jgi:hypothetical protein